MYRKQNLQQLWAWVHCWRFSFMIMMQMMTVTIRWTSTVQKAHREWSWSNLNSAGSKLPNRWGMPTRVHSTGGRKFGWLGVRRQNISPLSGGRTTSNSFQLYPCTGRKQVQIIWRQLWTGCRCIISTMLKGFGRSGLRFCWRNAQVQLESEEKGKARQYATCIGFRRVCEPPSEM